MIFQKHYSRDEARALLPRVRQWLDKLADLRPEYAAQEMHLAKLRAEEADLGGSIVNSWVRSMAAMQQVLQEFQNREIQVKDLERGLIDFPSIMDGREVFLCWEKHEDDIEYWHELDAGYAGREPL